MAIDASVALTNTNAIAFPGTEAVNASGPTAVDGTEYVKVLIDNYMFGPQQALLNYAGLTPDGLPEEDGASQELEALQKSFGYPGEGVNWYGDLDPAVVGARILLLQGQGILISQYPELTTSVYVGDGNNATAPAFYKADDAAGTIRNIAGIYLILPEGRDTLLQFRAQPEYTAIIANSGVATVASESLPFVLTATRNSVGQVTVAYTAGLFSVIPAPGADAFHTSFFASVLSYSATQVVITTRDSNGNLADVGFKLSTSRQAADNNPFGDDFRQLGIKY